MKLPLTLLAVILLLLFRRVQDVLRWGLKRHPQLLFAVPLSLAALFACAAWISGARSPVLMASIGVYSFVPAVIAWIHRSRAADILILLVLWLPLESGAGASLVPRHAQGYLHAVAYGVAVLLALWIFLGFRALPGMKYNWPSGPEDFRNPLLGYLLTAPVLIALGLYLGFLAPFHLPATITPARLLSRFAVILAATALPEEILFRSLIQNWISQRFGNLNLSVFAAAVIFGCSHLDNGPGALPNWTYGIISAVAGFAFGKVFQKSATVLSPALLHALVNSTKYFFF